MKERIPLPKQVEKVHRDHKKYSRRSKHSKPVVESSIEDLSSDKDKGKLYWERFPGA